MRNFQILIVSAVKIDLCKQCLETSLASGTHWGFPGPQMKIPGFAYQNHSANLRFIKENISNATLYLCLLRFVREFSTVVFGRILEQCLDFSVGTSSVCVRIFVSMIQHRHIDPLLT